MMSNSRSDRVAGVLVGQACADAAGAPYEFRPPVRPEQVRFGHARGTFGHMPAEFTDDTQMAVCVAAARSQPLKAAELFLTWFNAGQRDVGAHTGQVLRRARTPKGVPMAAKALARRSAAMPRPKGFDRGGANGSLMRCGPTCLPFLGDRDQIARSARKVSDLTHADPYCGDACVLWSLLVDAAVTRQDSGRPIVADVCDSLESGLGYIPADTPDDRRGYWQNVISKALELPPARFAARNGGAVSAFACALSAIAHSDSYESAVRLCISAGNDADTTAAICGALAGAMYGASAVPAAWRAKVHGWSPDGVLGAPGLERLALQAAGQ